MLAARHLLGLGLFGSTSAANEWLRRRQASREVRFYTRYRIRERPRQCKPEYYFHSADVRVKRDNARHECYLTEFLALYWRFAEALRRGPDVDRERLPDAELTIGGTRYFVELDTGEETHRQLRGRFKKLSGAADTVLFVTLGRDRRLGGVLQTATGFEDLPLVATTFAAVYSDPFGRVWHQPGVPGGTLRQLAVPPELLAEVPA